jgi:hypothetical protein
VHEPEDGMAEFVKLGTHYMGDAKRDDNRGELRGRVLERRG